MIIQQHIKFEDQDEHRLYEIWPGKNRFFFGGRLMTGSDADFHINLFTWVGLLLLPITFQYGHGKLVWEASKPLAISSIFLGFLTLFFLLLTQFSDPGIIPRQHIFEIIGKTWETENSWPICSTCQIKKPPGTSHCKQCDNCVQLLDHHCPFVNNCIGKRNYKYFVMFLACLLFQGLDIIISLNKIDPKGNNNLTDFLLIIVCFVSAIIGIFCFFHLIVILSGSTTRQIIKDLESTDRFDWVGNSPQLFDPMFNINQQAEQLV